MKLFRYGIVKRYLLGLPDDFDVDESIALLEEKDKEKAK